LQNILHKMFFAKNFVENNCEFNKFVGNNYPQKNYFPIQIRRKITKKKSFLTKFYNKFVGKISRNIKNSSSAHFFRIYTIIIK